MSTNNIEWTKLSNIKSFDDKPEQLCKVKRDDILVVKDDDNFYAINNRCPHLGLALNIEAVIRRIRRYIVNFILVIFHTKQER